MVSRRLVVAIISLLITVFATTSAWASVIYVKQDSPGPVFDGKSWATAFHKVQNAVDATAFEKDEIWVAAGTYVENLNINHYLSLYGGFAGTETSREDRDWLRNPTILDGNKAGSVIYYQPSLVLRIDGFTIRNGSSYNGGGVQEGTYIGPGYGSVVTVAHCKLIDNVAQECGGAVYSRDAVEVIDCTIRNNKAKLGGGIYAGNSCVIRDSVLEGNTATGNGGAVWSLLGGIVERCTFKGNRAAQGGAYYAAVNTTTDYQRVDIQQSKFTNNVATGDSSVYPAIPSRGGAVYIKRLSYTPTYAGWDVTVASCFFNGNAATDSGSAAYIEKSGCAIWFNSFAKNGTGSEGTIDLEDCSTLFGSNIIAFNTSGFKWNGSTLHCETNCIYQNAAYDFSGPAPSDDYGSISADPKFADVLAGNLHIQPDSPCVNAGAQTYGLLSDIDNHSRSFGSKPDIGADESNGIVWDENQVGVVYVSPKGSNQYDGSSWAKAKRTIQAGIDAASEKVAEVWVAAGTYNERITLKPNAWLYGGFAGTETDKSQRDWKVNKTVIDGTPAQGSEGGSVVSIIGIPYNLSCLDGFVIRGGSSPSSSGSTAGSAGGGVYCSASAISITHNVIKDNRTKRGGAGIYCINSPCKIVGNEICTNVTEYGGTTGWMAGAIWCEGAPTLIANNIVWGNYGYVTGGVALAGPVKFINNTLTDNFSLYGSGFSEDQIGGGSALALRDSQPIVANNIVAYNAGGISCNSSTPVALTNNCVYKNYHYDYMGVNLIHCADINVDPGFAGLDFSDYHLQAGSACIDAGDGMSATLLSEDMDREARLQGSRVDIGADESNGSARNAIAPVVCVGTAGSGLWSNVKRTIQEAIDALPEGGGEVWVKAGDHYVGNSAIRLRDHVQIYGGFTGNETSRSQRNWSKNVTRIIASKSGAMTAGMGCVRSTVDGFTITGGKAAGAGGGFFCDTGSAVTISHNRITGNSTAQSGMGNAGGGICAGSGAYTGILNNVIENNVSGAGAGIFVSTWAVITGNTIVYNTATEGYGGGVRSQFGDRIFNNVIAFNTGYGLDTHYETSSAGNYIYGNSPTNSTTPLPQGFTVADPLFINKDLGDYHLTPSSPCIDTGYNSALGILPTDFDGLDRLFMFTVDAGAYESYDLPASAAFVKLAKPQSKARLSGVVTAVFGSQFYIESPDRSSGIGCLLANHGLSVGDVVNVTGKVSINASFEKSLMLTNAAAVGKGRIEPLAMSNKSIGGSNLCFNPNTQEGQAGATGGIGPNNIGLLVKTKGLVTAAGSGYFYIDDGSGPRDSTQYRGIKIMISGVTPPSPGSYVSVTGISLPMRSSSSVYMLIKPRDANDIVILKK